MKGKITKHTVLPDKVSLAYVSDDNKTGSVNVAASYKAKSVSEGDGIRIEGTTAFWTPKDSNGRDSPVGELQLEPVGGLNPTAGG